MRRFLLLCALLPTIGCGAGRVTQFGRTDAVQGTTPAAISVYPVLILAGQPVQLTWRVESDPDNREWCIAITHEDTQIDERKFCETSFPRRIWQQSVENIPEGRYRAVLTVRRADGKERRVSTAVCFKGPETSCGPIDMEAPHDGTTRGADPF